MSTTSGVSSPGSIYADESNSTHETSSNVYTAMPVISDEEAGQILQSLEITPNADGIIDIGLAEFQTTPSSTAAGFDLSMFGEDCCKDGSSEITDESDTETYSDTTYYTTTESESEESDMEQLCNDAEKLNVK